MARTKQQIKQEMTTHFMANITLANLYGFNQGAIFENEFSLLSLENIIFDIVSFAIYWLEQMFATHRSEINEQLLNQKNARLPWYVFMAKRFQYGFPLVADTDLFINGDATTAQIEDSKIIKYAAVDEPEPKTVLLKIAGETDEELSPIPAEEFDAVLAYFKEVKPGGVKLTVINYEPDKLFINMRIYRDPLVLDENGMSILNGNYPVNDAIDEYMKELPFNGEFVIAHFVDKLQKVEGVKIPHILSVESSWIDPTTGGYGAPASVNVKTIPVSGYFKVAQFGISTDVNGGISYVV